jgi:acyl-CoA synthetase (AMP-forming)/AMP-acid ligase II
VPKALSEAYLAVTGLPILQAWGMTETSPLGTVCRITSSAMETLDEETVADLRTSVGQPVMGVEARITDPATAPEEPLPWDGVASGELQVRGPWITAGYHDHPAPDSFTGDGWLRTGDIATIDPRGYIHLVDRIKDVIKSGGEWISSVQLENEIMAHPGVAEAAVIGVPQAKWGERPVAYVVLKPGPAATDETRTDLRDHLKGRVPTWWLPDEIIFIDQIPKTSVGKFAKKQLRETFANRSS